ncbi:rod binding protein [Aliiruegeria haliotis]|uniref:Rod binding protein n=1 Tax=Aliiruegeria haliotis TaxID=1280846 RepID=A0A2T0RE67_9RHOB|nr:chemotaxis protein chel [Aliiruegeria haliotis]PRY19458.1 rod binding protein [Aliiruegeria haliotis]
MHGIEVPIWQISQSRIPSANTRLREVAEELEASFLSEMLKCTGLGKAPEALGGGIGEEQFSSFLRNAQAAEVVRAGGIGMAEAIFESLKGMAHGAR